MFSETSPSKAFTMVEQEGGCYIYHRPSGQGAVIPRSDAGWLANAISRWLTGNQPQPHDHVVEIGTWPAYVHVGLDEVSIESDHNTDSHYTGLNRPQVLALYHALGNYLMRTEA